MTRVAVDGQFSSFSQCFTNPPQNNGAHLEGATPSYPRAIPVRNRMFFPRGFLTLAMCLTWICAEDRQSTNCVHRTVSSAAKIRPRGRPEPPGNGGRRLAAGIQIAAQGAIRQGGCDQLITRTETAQFRVSGDAWFPTPVLQLMPQGTDLAETTGRSPVPIPEGSAIDRARTS